MHWEPFSSVGRKRQRGNVDGGVGAGCVASEAWREGGGGGGGGDQGEVKGGGFELRFGGV